MKNVQKIKNQNGITLIALVITIIVLLILAGITITTLTGDNGLFGKTTESGFKSEIKQYEEELRLKIGEEEIDSLGNRTNVINVFKKFPSTGEENENFESEMKANIPSFNNSKYGNKLEIRNDELIYIDEENLQERKWFSEVQLSLSKYFITVNYVDKQGNKLAEPEIKSTITGLYEIEPKIIEGYEAERPLYEGRTKEDTEITITYLQESGDLEYIGLDENGNETNDESKIIAYTVSGIGNFAGEDLVIPRTYNNKSVVQVKTNAFYCNSTIKKLIIPQTIKKVENNAFDSCTKIEYLNLNAKAINSYNTFINCSNLKNIDIGKNVETFGYWVFYSCKKLTDVKIYSEKVDISSQLFSGCSLLKEVKINEKNNKYAVIDGILYSKDKKKIYMYPPAKEGEYMIPNYLEEIGTYAFSGNHNITKIKIPSTTKIVGASAFEGCKNIEHIDLDAEIIKSYYAFGGCSNLKEINIGKNVKSMGHWMFSSCKNIEKLNYLGTISEWNNINIAYEWKNNSNITKIICSDGEVDV